MHSSQASLYIALRFPLLGLHAHDCDVSTQNVLLGSKRRRVIAASAECLDDGVLLGMPVSTAQLLSDCEVFACVPKKEDRLLESLCAQLYNFTPYIHEHKKHYASELSSRGLVLEVSRCVNLFKGFKRLQSLILEAVDDMGFAYRVGVARQVNSAWLLSFQKKPKNSECKYLLELPLKLLDLPLATIDAFEKTGFSFLQDIYVHLQSEGVHALKKRFGDGTIDYLQSLLREQLSTDANNDKTSMSEKKGTFDLFLPPIVPPPIFADVKTVYQPLEYYCEYRQFEYPISLIEHLQAPMQGLLDGLCQYLVTKQKQGSFIRWVFFDIYQNTACFDVRCERIFKDWQLLFNLSSIQLEQQGLPFEVDGIELQCSKFFDVDFTQQTLAINPPFGLHQNTQKTANKALTQTSLVPAYSDALELLTARLHARLGEENVYKLTFRDDHLPDYSHDKVAANTAVNTTLKAKHCYADRPAWIFNTAVKIGKHQNDLYWHGTLHIIRGPERIEGHWWDKPSLRDYFIATRDDHTRLWVFNDILKQQWYIQGVF